MPLHKFFLGCLSFIFFIRLFISVRAHISAPAVDPGRIVEPVDIFEYACFCFFVVFESVKSQPFPFDQWMETFYACIVPGIAFSRIRSFHSSGFFFICAARILHASVAVKNQRRMDISSSLGFFHASYDRACFQRFRQIPGYDLSWIQVHDACQVYKSFLGPYIGDVCTPDAVRCFRIKISF